MKPITLIVGGDLAPTKTNYSFFTDGKISDLFGENLLSLVNSVDYRIFNLEVPLTDKQQPIEKDGPNLIAPASSVNGMRALNPVVFGMANNHILDHDEQGLLSTLDRLSENKLGYVGAGRDLQEAEKPFIIEKEGVKVGVYACAENEFSIATGNQAGANPFDPLESLDHIVRLKSECDFVIVLHHGGKEHYRYPSPGLRKVCRKMAEKGADLIVCQHSHCIGAFEKYSDSMIVYGQGNFLFDRRDNEFWNTGLLIKAVFGNEMSIEFVPVSKNGNGVRMSDPHDAVTILKEFNERSENIARPGFLEAEYEKYCNSNGLFYLGAVAGLGRITRKIDRLSNGIITRNIYSRNQLSMLQNFIECETHRELLLRYVNGRRKRK